MIRLMQHREPRWLTLPYGVKVEVKPLTTAINEAAFAEARRIAAVLIVEAAKAAEAGMPMDPRGPNGANAAYVEGVRAEAHVAALARYGILRWEGVLGDDGAPLAVSADACEAFAQHREIGAAFLNAYTDDVHALAAEGNGFMTTSAGGLAVVASTAEPAQTAPDTQAPNSTEAPAETVPA